MDSKVAIGFIVAMKQEADVLASALGLQPQEENENSCLLYKNDDESIVMITPGTDKEFIGFDNTPVCRAGKVSAGIATTILVHKFAPKMIINCGTAAGVAENGVEIGDIIVADYVANHDIHIPLNGYKEYGLRKIPLNINDTFSSISQPFKIGTVSSGESFTTTLDQWQTMITNNTFAKEMEAAGVLQAVQILKYTPPVYVIKVATDQEQSNTPSNTQAEDFVNNFTFLL